MAGLMVSSRLVYLPSPDVLHHNADWLHGPVPPRGVQTKSFDPAKHPRGEHGHFSHTEAREMRRMALEGKQPHQIEAYFGVHPAVVDDVLHYRTHREQPVAPGEKPTIHHAREIRYRAQHETISHGALGAEYNLSSKQVWHILHHTTLKEEVKPAPKAQPPPPHADPHHGTEEHLRQGVFTGQMTALKGKGNINQTYVGAVQHKGVDMPVIVKPAAGLSNKKASQLDNEAASYLIARHMGDYVRVPETVVRDSPKGKAMVQRMIPNAPQYGEIEHTFTAEERAALAPHLHRLALFDEVTGNADRHAGNAMVVGRGATISLVGVDHGLSLGVPKYKSTGIAITKPHWHDSLTAEDRSMLYGLTDHWQEVHTSLKPHLSDEQIQWIRSRIDRMLLNGKLGTDMKTW